MIQMKIPMNKIKVNGKRNCGQGGDINFLAFDMRDNGLICPITVQAIKDGDKWSGDYEVVAGYRLYAAAKLLGWKTIEVYSLETYELGQIGAGVSLDLTGLQPDDAGEEHCGDIYTA